MTPHNQSEAQSIKATQPIETMAQNQPEHQRVSKKLLVIVDDWMDHDNPNMMNMAGDSVSSAESLTLLYIVEPCTVNLGVRPIPQAEEAKLKKILGALFNEPDPLVCRPGRKPRREIRALRGQIPLYILLRADFKHKEWIEEILNMPGLVSDLVGKLKEESVFEDDPVFKRLPDNERVHDEEVKDKFRQLLRWCYPRPNGDVSQSRRVAKLLALDYIEDLASEGNYNSNRIKFFVDTCFNKGKTVSPLGRTVDHPSYLINRNEKELADYVKIIDSKSKEEIDATQKKLDFFEKLRKPGAPLSADAAREMDKLIEDEDDAKLRAEKDKAERIMGLLKNALNEQRRKLANLLKVPRGTEFVSDLQMGDLVEAIDKAPSTRMFCGTSLTIPAELQKRGVAPKVKLFGQGGSTNDKKNIVGHAYNFALNPKAAKFVFEVQIGSYKPKPGEPKPARFESINLGSTDIGQDVGFDPEALWRSSKLQMRWTSAYGVSRFRRDPFAMLQKPQDHPLSEKEKKRMISADSAAWLAATSESFNKDYRDVRKTSPKTMLVMKKSGAIIFSFEKQRNTVKAFAYPIPHGRIEMLMPNEKIADPNLPDDKKVALSAKDVKRFMSESKARMEGDKDGWACSKEALTSQDRITPVSQSEKTIQALTAGGNPSKHKPGLGSVRPQKHRPYSHATDSRQKRLNTIAASTAPAPRRPADRETISAARGQRATTLAQPRPAVTSSHN